MRFGNVNIFIYVIHINKLLSFDFNFAHRVSLTDEDVLSVWQTYRNAIKQLERDLSTNVVNVSTNYNIFEFRLTSIIINNNEKYLKNY